jgi:hypothetical protein
MSLWMSLSTSQHDLTIAFNLDSDGGKGTMFTPDELSRLREFSRAYRRGRAYLITAYRDLRLSRQRRAKGRLHRELRLCSRAYFMIPQELQDKYRERLGEVVWIIMDWRVAAEKLIGKPAAR